MKGIKITHAMWLRYNKVLSALANGERKTSNELAELIHMGKSSMGNIISAMLRKHYIEKHRVPGAIRSFKYSALATEVPISEVVGMMEPVEIEPEVKVPGARVISFDTDDMKRKLIEQDKQIRADRKRHEVHIGTSWGLV